MYIVINKGNDSSSYFTAYNDINNFIYLYSFENTGI